MGHSASFFSGNNGCAAASKRIKHKIGASRGVFENVSDEGNRFDGRVAGELVKPACFKCIHTGVVPNIAAVTPVPAEFDVIDVRRGADFEDGDQFVFGSIE